jgi:hypothetical protein
MESNEEIIILCTEIRPRLEYVAHFLSTISGVTFKVSQTHNYNNKYVIAGSCVINYDQKSIDGAFNVFATGLLHETGIRKQVPIVAKHGEQILLFPAPAAFDLPFDLFSAIFYLLSRYEEYLPFKPDMHGRFEADQSLAFHNAFLEEPVIDQWVEMLQTALLQKYPALKFRARKFGYVSTIDVDSPWAFLHKGLIRTFGGLLKALVKARITEFHIRWGVLRGKCRDPFDNFAYIREIERKYDFRSRLFFLLGNSGKFDTNYALGTPDFKRLLHSLKTNRIIGIHPSYASNRNVRLVFKTFKKETGNQPSTFCYA